MAYPDDILAPRAKENMPNVVYDAAKKSVFFVEDLQALENDLIQIETLLGLGPFPAIETLMTKLIGMYTQWGMIYRGQIEITPAIGMSFPKQITLVSNPLNPIPTDLATALLTGTYFQIKNGPSTTEFSVLASYYYSSISHTHTFMLYYVNHTSGMMVVPPTYPVGGSILHSPRIDWQLDFNAIYPA